MFKQQITTGWPSQKQSISLLLDRPGKTLYRKTCSENSFYIYLDQFKKIYFKVMACIYCTSQKGIKCDFNFSLFEILQFITVSASFLLTAP